MTTKKENRRWPQDNPDGTSRELIARIVHIGAYEDTGNGFQKAKVDITSDEGDEVVEFGDYQKKFYNLLEVGQSFKLSGVQGPYTDGTGWWNPNIRKVVSITDGIYPKADVSAPEKPAPAPTPAPGPVNPESLDPTLILEGSVNGQARGHCDNLALQIYFHTEGALCTTMAQVIRDLPKIVELKNQLWLEFAGIPYHNQEWWKFHYCDLHSAYRTQSPRSGRWYHMTEVDGVHGACAVVFDDLGNESSKFFPNPNQPQPKPEPKPEPVADDAAEDFFNGTE